MKKSTIKAIVRDIIISTIIVTFFGLVCSDWPNNIWWAVWLIQSCVLGVLWNEL